MNDLPRFLPAGDRALLVEFGSEINPEINYRVRSLHYALRQNRLPGLGESVPTYRSLLVYYDPLELSYERLVEHIARLAANLGQMELPRPLIYLIPVAYGGEYGPDLADVAAHCRLAPEEVIRVHSSVDYLIYMLGFTPGFAYLGGMPRAIAAPRLEKPRSLVPAGSVGIAGEQTGIYPVDSPGGWRIIGRTPLKLYDPHRQPPVLLAAGNYVRFVPVGPQEYAEIKAAVERGAYEVKTLPAAGEER
ncbi:5-oxoprolinase subunit PxpB [Desulfovirgula thermocuniculi]|uniref:5-oxoprolinase subunit PxpB n=1 Tax=Desulfovirgula thermocuniculi TaxID=348842 RepID=UPI00041F8E0B|nr:5-oxoprolinase subunit PxpB [Desulfovirgula thermocuniculi]